MREKTGSDGGVKGETDDFFFFFFFFCVIHSVTELNKIKNKKDEKIKDKQQVI